MNIKANTKKQMNKVKIVKMDSYSIEFENGVKLYSNHDSDCCENHYLSLKDLTMADFKGLEFDLTNDNFFKRIEDYGIELILTNDTDFKKEYDITECQVISD